MSASILVRNNNGAAWDPLWGEGQANYLADIYAVAQIIQQKLQLLLGEWWENTNLGFPLFQSILGQFTPPAQISLLIQQQILSTPFVTGIQDAQITLNPNTREVLSSYRVTTQFGIVTVTGVNATFTAAID
jgi:hypothetical protein